MATDGRHAELVSRLNEQGAAIVLRAVRNPDIKGPLLEIARLLADAAGALAAYEHEDCEHCGRTVYQYSANHGRRP